ncbi:MAG: hypothetical protein JO255_01330, partial [Alphaproteobacteria bacterium]|nr:hypothetical protein [Alphaproteobacteria bacterium]
GERLWTGDSLTDDLPLERHERFRRLYDYLGAKAPPGRLPGRQHIDPAEIADLLPYITLLEVDRRAEGGRAKGARTLSSSLNWVTQLWEVMGTDLEFAAPDTPHPELAGASRHVEG